MAVASVDPPAVDRVVATLQFKDERADDMTDADETTAPSDMTPSEDSEDDIEVWVVNDDEEIEPIHKEPVAEEAVSRDLEAMRSALDEAKGQWMRTLADFDNFRKRAEREKSELHKYALLEPMRELLPVIDNLERAVSAGGTVEDLKQGVEMTLLQFRELLRRRGLEPVSAVGHPFDPAVHDAVSRFEDAEVEHPTVAEELQRGYRIHDRLLRPAMVRVAMPPEPDAEPES
jgi:molecular chaperone GrpE